MILTEIICEGRYHGTPAFEQDNDDFYESISYFHGLRHNEDDPAYIKEIKKDGKIICRIKEWWFLDMKHNEKGPAIHIQDFDLNGNLIGDLKMWYHFDNLDNKDSPAIIEDRAGLHRTVFYQNGLKHNLGGYAEYIKSNFVILYAWYFKGKLHNMNNLAKDYTYKYNDKIMKETITSIYGEIINRTEEIIR